MRWFDPIILGFAALIVFPDYVLGWLSDQTGKVFNLLHLLLLEALAILGLWLFMVFAMQYEPRLDWWHPLISIFLMAGFRMIYSFINSLFE